MELVRGDFTQTRNHWWWRPGWGPGTRYATFHLTFELSPELATEAVRCGLSLAGVPNVDVVPPEWLHLTMTGVGSTDDHYPEALLDLADAVFVEVDELDRQPLRLDGLYLGQEGLSLVADSARWLMELKRLQQEMIKQRLGVEHEEQRFHPHVSLAYFRGEVDLSLLHQGIEEAAPRDVVIARPMLSLIELGRDDEVYTWRVLSQYALRG